MFFLCNLFSLIPASMASAAELAQLVSRLESVAVKLESAVGGAARKEPDVMKGNDNNHHNNNNNKDNKETGQTNN